MNRAVIDEQLAKIKAALEPTPPHRMSVDRLEAGLNLGKNETRDMVAYLRYWIRYDAE